MEKVFLSLGSNLGDRLNSLLKANGQIEDLIGKVVQYSPVIETEPWGFSAATPFLNQVVMVETDLLPQQVLSVIMDIEKKMGRIRAGKTYISRIIDIDILFYGNKIIEEKNLVIPHPLLHLRKFVLEPLFAVAPEFVHPVTGKTIAALHSEVMDACQVQVAVGKDEFTRLLNS